MTELPDIADIPDDLDACKSIIRQMLFRSHLFIGQARWNEGYWFYRDRSTNKLFLVAGALKEGIPVVLVSHFDRIRLLGETGPSDSVERNHVQGVEIVNLKIDEMGDFQSAAERFQGKLLT